MVVADWGSSDIGIQQGNTIAAHNFLGGTQAYAGPNTFELSLNKDLYSFGHLAMELMLDKSGTDYIEWGTCNFGHKNPEKNLKITRTVINYPYSLDF